MENKKGSDMHKINMLQCKQFDKVIFLELEKF